MAKTILLADDSSTIRRIVELTFSDTAYRVETVDSGAAAMERLRTLQPDLILADVAMPAPTGYEICREVKQSKRPVPVVLLAGTFEPFDADYAARCGADGHLVKPFESEALRRKVELLLAPAERRGKTADVAAEAPATVVAGEPEPAAAEPVADEPAATDSAVPSAAPAEVSAELVDAVARAVVEKLSTEVLRQIAWEVVPDLATVIIRERIRELEREES